MTHLVPPPRRHLQPHADVAERVLAPGDPGRALRLAQWLLEQPKMLNHHRGLWGYTGRAADGELLTVQSTGMGGAGAVIVLEDLVELGARRVIRVGTCGALDNGTSLGELLVVRGVIGEDGASRALGAPQRQEPDAGLADALREASGARAREVTVVSTDVWHDLEPALADVRRRALAEVVDLETAGLFAAASRLGVAAACILAVTDVAGRDPARRLEAEGVAAAEEAMGQIAAAALS